MVEITPARCPNCGQHFSVNTFVGEEPLCSNATLIRPTSYGASWADIRELIVGEGCKHKYALSVGDKICFRLKDGTETFVYVAAIDHYDPNSVIFSFGESLWSAAMAGNAREVMLTAHCGWSDSSMVEFLEKTVLPQLPDELAEVIAPRNIDQRLEGYICLKKSKLWLPSVVEVFGESVRDEDCEFSVKQFPLFETLPGRMCYCEGGSYAKPYWTRSPKLLDRQRFWGVNYYGYASAVYTYCLSGARPCFTIQ